MPEPTTASPSEPTPAQAAALRLVVADMDGTLLDADGRIPDSFWPLLHRLRERGIAFAPASGRQYAKLAHMFEGEQEHMPFIAENGTFVVRDGVELTSTTLDRSFVVEAVGILRDLAAGGVDLGAVVCGKRSAYVERSDAPFLAEVRGYYATLAVVEDVLAPDDDILKIAVYDFGDAEVTTLPALAPFSATQQVVLSSHHWIDVMDRDVSKGAALRRLYGVLGLSPDQTAVFGDYLNDLELLDAATLSFAMANAHPDALARARYVAPPNTEAGLVTAVTQLLDAAGRDAGGIEAR